MNKEKIQGLIDEYIAIRKVFGNILDAPSRGGNISVKDGQYLIIKASGEDLKKKHKIAILKNQQNIATYADELKNERAKPSMELGLHQVFKNKYVAHYHPVYILPYLCDFNFIFPYRCIEFKLPGVELFQAVQEDYIYEKSGIVMLRNHGVVVFAEDKKDLFALHQRLRKEFFEPNQNIFTPDDAVDVKSEELWLFREAIENIARKKNLALTQIKNEYLDKLIHMPQEQYRLKQINKEVK